MGELSKKVAELYGLVGDWDEDIFTLHNPSGSDVFFDLFNPILSYQTNVPIVPNPTFYITGSSNYNFSVRDFFLSPAWVRRIYVYSQNNANLQQVITHLYKDANGNEVQMPRIPSMSIGINQFQGWIAELNFDNKECVLGINQWFQNVLIKSGSEIGFLLIYKQIDKAELLSIGSTGETITSQVLFTYNSNVVRRWSEKDLFLNDYTEVTPFKQNMFLGETEDYVQPFDFSILNMYVGKTTDKNNQD